MRDFIMEALIFRIHSIFGEMILPVLIVAAALYLTITYKVDAPQTLIARLFPFLVDLQIGLGLLLWVMKLLGPLSALGYYQGFPFIMHPVLGLLAMGLGHLAMDERNPVRSFRRWAPLASLGVLLLLVVGNALLVRLV